MKKQNNFTKTFSISFVSLFSQAPNFDHTISKSNNGVNWNNQLLCEATSGITSAAQHAKELIFYVLQWFPAHNFPTNKSFNRIVVKQSLNEEVLSNKLMKKVNHEPDAEVTMHKKLMPDMNHSFYNSFPLKKSFYLIRLGSNNFINP